MSSKSVLAEGTIIRISKTEATSTANMGEDDFETLDCTSREVSFQGGTSAEIDVTTLCSTAEEIRMGMPKGGAITVTGHWVQSDPGQKVVRQANKDKKRRLLEVEFSDGSIFASLAYATQRSWSSGVDGVNSGTFNFRLTGESRETDGTTPAGNGE